MRSFDSLRSLKMTLMTSLYVRIVVMASKKLRIGFDFDGVIAYNPLRVLRAPVMSLRNLLRKKDDPIFPVPQTKPFRFLWALAHETSFYPSYGLSNLKKLMKEGKVEGYLVTGRYSFLESSLLKWLKKHGLESAFKGIYLNRENKQPHLFKEEMINKLKLDMFVEDNWDIVSYLSERFKKSSKKVDIHWIYNLLDRTKPYQKKYPHLKKFIDTVTRQDDTR